MSDPKIMQPHSELNAYRRSSEPLDKFLNRYVFVKQGDLVFDLENHELSTLAEFLNATAGVKHIKKTPEGERLELVSTDWLGSFIRKTANGVTYDPARPAFFQDNDRDTLWCVNKFHTPNHTPGFDGDTSIFHNHMDYLFPIKQERDWFVDWIAFNIQYPERRCKVTPLHTAPPGTGRGWVVELMNRLLGHWNCTQTAMDKFFSNRFNDYLINSTFCVVRDDPQRGDQYRVAGQIKRILTDDTAPVDRGYGNISTERVYINLLLLTSRPDALMLMHGDTRINVFSGPDEIKPDQYHCGLYDWLDTDGVAALHRELMQRDLYDFKCQTSMHTKGRAALLAPSL